MARSAAFKPALIADRPPSAEHRFPTPDRRCSPEYADVRTGGFTSLAVVAGAVGVWAGFQRADAIAGLVISLAILAVLRVAVVEVFRRLMNGVDPEIVDQLDHAAHQAPGVTSVRDIRVRWEGHRLRAELTVGADPTLNLADTNQLAPTVEHELLYHVPHLDAAAIRVEPDSP